MIKYIYTGWASITAFDAALGLLDAARRYSLPDLGTIVTIYFKTALTTKNVFAALSAAAENDADEATNACMTFIEDRSDTMYGYMLNGRDLVLITVGQL